MDPIRAHRAGGLLQVDNSPGQAAANLQLKYANGIDVGLLKPRTFFIEILGKSQRIKSMRKKALINQGLLR
jgi:hypothetical protein